MKVSNIGATAQTFALQATARGIRAVLRGIMVGLGASIGVSLFAAILGVHIYWLLYLLIVPWFIAASLALSMTSWIRTEASYTVQQLLGASDAIRAAMVAQLEARLPAGVAAIPAAGVGALATETATSVLAGRLPTGGAGIVGGVVSRAANALANRVAGRLSADLVAHAQANGSDHLTPAVLASYAQTRLAAIIDQAVATQLAPLTTLRWAAWATYAFIIGLTVVAALF